MGWTANTGNPRGCNNDTGSIICVPADLSCDSALSWTRVGANPGPSFRTVSRNIVVGSLVGQVGVDFADNSVFNTTFTNFHTGKCWQGGALGWHNMQSRFLGPGARVSGLRFINSDNNRFFFNASLAKSTRVGYVVGDPEGTIAGVRDSVLVVANNTGLLPPGGCPDFLGGMKVCQDVCYRTILLQYKEPKDFNARQFPKGPWTSLQITRELDGTQSTFQTATANPKREMQRDAQKRLYWKRRYLLLVLAGYTHHVKILNRDPKAPQPALYFMYDDISPPSTAMCSEPIILLPENSQSPLLPSKLIHFLKPDP
eukprot:jgi/Botrbrau1/10240/Bobra.0362s0029.1